MRAFLAVAVAALLFPAIAARGQDAAAPAADPAVKGQLPLSCTDKDQ